MLSQLPTTCKLADASSRLQTGQPGGRLAYQSDQGRSLVQEVPPDTHQLASRHLPACLQTLPYAPLAHWPGPYSRAVQALLLCAQHGRRRQLDCAAAAESCGNALSVQAIAQVDVQAGGEGAFADSPADSSAGTAPAGCSHLARLPHDLLLRVAVLAAAPLSAWQA